MRPSTLAKRIHRRSLSALRLCLFLAVLLPALGCVRSDPAEFRLNMIAMAKSEISETRQQEVADVLGAMFGTPDEPFAFPEAGVDLRKVRVAAGPVHSDEDGTTGGLFRRHCVHCHGITGDGEGPTASFLNPYPRDYRQGKFKFKSTERPEKPTRHDLKQLLIRGIPGTAMPSFALLSGAELDALVEYVVYLSIRGETETALVAFAFDELDEEDRLAEQGQEILVGEILGGVGESWERAEDLVIHTDPESLPPPRESLTPDELAASIDHGRELFYGTKANCIKCHGQSALGDGQTNDFDDWNKQVKEFIDNLTNPDPESEEYQEQLAQRARELEIVAAALPVRNIFPRNLRLGVYRGGRRPLDLYRRMHAGINGTPMPGVGPASPGAKGVLSPEEIWHVVHYVQSLPFEEASRPPEASLNKRIVQ